MAALGIETTYNQDDLDEFKEDMKEREEEREA